MSARIGYWTSRVQSLVKATSFIFNEFATAAIPNRS
jgi:hypothetical protein